MSDNRSDRVWRYVVEGHAFNEGVCSALRAYPNVFAVRQNADETRLVLEVVADGASSPDMTLFTAVIVRAGGHVDGISEKDL